MDRKIDEIDEMFLKYFSENDEIPNIVEEKIKSALADNKKSNRTILTIKKIIAIIVGLFTITGSIVFANDIKALVLNLFKYNVGIFPVPELSKWESDINRIILALYN